MSEREAIRQALANAGMVADIAAMRNLSGGCIHQVLEVALSDGRIVVAKINAARMLRLFEEEAHSLGALAATHVVLTPQPLACLAHGGTAVLLMTKIEAPRTKPTDTDWQRFGRELAALHQSETGGQPRYGFDMDNHIGSTPQPNSWHEDWVEFNAINRLGFQAATARDIGLLEPDEVRKIETVVARLDQFIPRHPSPSLLHGDLWSGNALPGADGLGQTRIALIDPASSIGDGWADLAMMKLFGGFPQACFDSYANVIAPPDDLQTRLAVYQLYHVLNHVNIFGGGYVGQAMNLAQQVLRGK